MVSFAQDLNDHAVVHLGVCVFKATVEIGVQFFFPLFFFLIMILSGLSYCFALNSKPSFGCLNEGKLDGIKKLK